MCAHTDTQRDGSLQGDNTWCRHASLHALASAPMRLSHANAHCPLSQLTSGAMRYTPTTTCTPSFGDSRPGAHTRARTHTLSMLWQSATKNCPTAHFPWAPLARDARAHSDTIDRSTPTYHSRCDGSHLAMMPALPLPKPHPGRPSGPSRSTPTTYTCNKN